MWKIKKWVLYVIVKAEGYLGNTETRLRKLQLIVDGLG